MGQTNLKHALERKYAMFKGELGDKQKRVDEIEMLFREELPALSDRTKRLHRLMECAEELLHEIDPAWKPENTRAVRPNVHKAPVEIGRISKTALDVLRESPVPLTIRQITDQLLLREGVGPVDAATRRRITNSVDATLRQKLEKHIVAHDGARFARKWWILSVDERRSYLKAANTSS